MRCAFLDLSLQNPFGNFLVSKRQGVLAFFITTLKHKYTKRSHYVLLKKSKYNLWYCFNLCCNIYENI